MAEGLLLGAAPDVVEGLVGEADDVEPVKDQLGVEAVADAGGVAAERVDRRHPHERPPLERLGFEPVGDHLPGPAELHVQRSEEHTSELQSLMRISYAVFCLKKNKQN